MIRRLLRYPAIVGYNKAFLLPGLIWVRLKKSFCVTLAYFQAHMGYVKSGLKQGDSIAFIMDEVYFTFSYDNYSFKDFSNSIRLWFPSH